MNKVKYFNNKQMAAKRNKVLNRRDADNLIIASHKLFMMLETGGLSQWTPDIADNPQEGLFQYAILNKGELIGFLQYYVDYYSSCAYNFGLLSFDRGNPLVGRAIFEKMEELISTMHRVEWRMVGGNPVERSYDRFCEKHGGTKHVMKDAVRDVSGEYRDRIIYEIIKEEV